MSQSEEEYGDLLPLNDFDKMAIIPRNAEKYEDNDVKAYAGFEADFWRFSSQENIKALQDFVRDNVKEFEKDRLLKIKARTKKQEKNKKRQEQNKKRYKQPSYQSYEKAILWLVLLKNSQNVRKIQLAQYAQVIHQYLPSRACDKIVVKFSECTSWSMQQIPGFNFNVKAEKLDVERVEVIIKEEVQPNEESLPSKALKALMETKARIKEKNQQLLQFKKRFDKVFSQVLDQSQIDKLEEMRGKEMTELFERHWRVLELKKEEQIAAQHKKI